MIVQLSHQVEVLITIDTEADTVDRVAVLDEAIRPTLNAYDQHGEPVTAADWSHVNTAREIANTSAWPAWTFGR